MNNDIMPGTCIYPVRRIVIFMIQMLSDQKYDAFTNGVPTYLPTHQNHSHAIARLRARPVGYRVAISQESFAR